MVATSTTTEPLGENTSHHSKRLFVRGTIFLLILASYLALLYLSYLSLPQTAAIGSAASVSSTKTDRTKNTSNDNIRVQASDNALSSIIGLQTAAIRDQIHTFKAYYEANPISVTSFISLLYLFKQTFAIPGSAIVNVLVGAIIGFPNGFILICVLSATGASCCFLLSKYLFGDIIIPWLTSNTTSTLKIDPNSYKHKLQKLRSQIQQHRRRSLLSFLIGLRIFPFTPNWFINIVSPFLSVPLAIHFLSCLIGLAPYNYVCVEVAAIMAELAEGDFDIKREILSPTNLATLTLLSFVVLVAARTSGRVPAELEKDGVKKD